MKQLIALVSLLFITATGWPNPHARTSAALSVKQLPDTTLNGRWQLMPVLASDTAAGKLPFLDFDLASGRFSGNTGCNNISGGFLVSQNALQFNEHLISTRRLCAGYNEKAFMENLIKTNRYEIKDGVLQLMYNATILSKWVRHVDVNQEKKV